MLWYRSIAAKRSAALHCCSGRRVRSQTKRTVSNTRRAQRMRRGGLRLKLQLRPDIPSLPGRSPLEATESDSTGPIWAHERVGPRLPTSRPPALHQQVRSSPARPTGWRKKLPPDRAATGPERRVSRRRSDTAGQPEPSLDKVARSPPYGRQLATGPPTGTLRSPRADRADALVSLYWLANIVIRPAPARNTVTPTQAQHSITGIKTASTALPFSVW